MTASKPTYSGGVTVNLADLLNEDPGELAAKIEGKQLLVRFSLEDTYSAQTRQQIADGWRTAWYICEMLAQHGSSPTCEFEGDTFGTAHYTLAVFVNVGSALAARLIEFAPVFDPNDLEPAALFWDETVEWVENRGDYMALFPELEAIFLDEQARADEIVSEQE